MKKSVVGGFLLSLLASAATWSCTDGYGTGFGQSDGMGGVSLSADLDPTMVTARASRAEYNTVGVGDLNVRLISADGSTLGPWTVAEFQNEERRFNVGVYTVEAFYGTASDEGFEKPYFYGKAEQIKVEENKTSSVSLTATVGNAVVAVRYTDAFKDYMNSWSTTVKNTTVVSGDTRPVYVQPGDVTVDVSFVKQNGNSATMQVKKFTAEAAHYYTLTVDIATETGVAEGITVSLDDSVEDEDVVIDISDEVLSAPAPEVTAAGFTPGEPYLFVSGQKFDSSVGFNILARGGLKSVVLTTASQALVARGWPAEVELIGASASLQSTLENLGLSARGLFHNPDMMAVLDLGKVLSGLPYSDVDNTHTFTIKVVDKFGKASEPMTLEAKEQKIELAISNAVLYVGSTSMSLQMNYNGGDPTGVIEMRKVTASGGNGALLNATYEKTGENTYKVICSGASLKTEETISVFARSKNDASVLSNTLEVTPVPMLIVDESREVNAFARTATLPVTMGKDNSGIAQSLAQAKIVARPLTTRSGDFAEVKFTYDASARTITLEELNPGTTYEIKIVDGDNESPSVSFNTEAALQLPNGSLDEDVEIVSSARNWENVKFNGWGTANEMTTSQGSNYGYCRISGTIQTSDAHNGSAALIRSVGWGSGNSATGSNGTSGSCKYTDAGMLHLGANRTVHRGDSEFSQQSSTNHGSILTDDIDCGIDFASRPSGLSFWYKYSAKNSSDRGLAEVHVYDAAGNEIASGTLQLNPTGSYTQQTIPLSYATATKAARLYVKFMSTYSSQFLVRTNSNFSGPGFANLSRGTFMGSQLYIDDIELMY